MNFDKAVGPLDDGEVLCKTSDRSGRKVRPACRRFLSMKHACNICALISGPAAFAASAASAALAAPAAPADLVIASSV